MLENERSLLLRLFEAAVESARPGPAVLRHLPDIIRESVKPMEAIDGIKIVQLEGLQSNSNHGGGGESATAAGNGNLADQVVSSALRYRAQAPLIESLMKDDAQASTRMKAMLDRMEATAA